MWALENVLIYHCLAYCSNFPNASSGSTEIPVELGVWRTLGEGLGEGLGKGLGKGLARELPDSRREGKGEGMARAVVIGGNAGGAGRGREERAAMTGGNGGGAWLDPGTGKGEGA